MSELLSRFRGPLGVAAALVAIGLILPWITDDYVIHIAIQILLFAFLGQSWNILGGYAGQFSFGHAAFFGIGAYASTSLYLNYGLSPWVGMVVGAAVAALVGLGIGFLSFRYGLHGPYFALATLAFAEILRLLALNWSFVGAQMGMLIPIKGSSLYDFQFSERPAYYYVILAFTGLAYALTYRLERSKTGRYWVAIRENQDAAEALGIDTMAYKLVAMAISAALAAIGGTFYAQYLFYVDSALAFGVDQSVSILLGTIIGGPGTLYGPLLGSALLAPLSEVTRGLIAGHHGLSLMIYGALLVAVILFLPGGLADGISRLRARLSRPRTSEPLAARAGVSATRGAEE
ncbi:MAG: branched-chain amino acid ABC transporter permease [Chloroflexi bacterium]|nr:branched-chain amino acid ABC transporter permease [Chloroflexota bacterium]